MDALILREGGVSFVAPSVQERPLEDHGESLHFVERLESGAFDLLICMTGSGLAFLRDQLAASDSLDRLSAALKRVAIVSRGPKPLPILRDLGTRADVTVPEPNTWREIVEAVAARPERRILVQEYGRPNPEMTDALTSLGAEVTPLVMYRWDLPEDIAPLHEAVRRLAGRQIDVVLFTSSIQLDHLLLIARKMGLEQPVCDALRTYTVNASVGPIMTSRLAESRIPVDVTPVHPKMAGLVKAAADAAAGVIQSKRIARLG